MYYLTLKEVLTILSLLLGVSAAFVVNPFVKWLIKMFKRMKDVWTVSDRLKKLDEIHAQLTTNGGSTLRDSIDRIEKKVAFNTEYIRQVDRSPSRAVFHTNALGDYEWVNRTYQNLVDKDAVDLLDQGWITCIAPEDRSLVVKEWEEAIEDQRDFELEYNIINSSGVRVLVHCIAKLIKSEGRVFGYMGIITIKHANN